MVSVPVRVISIGSMHQREKAFANCTCTEALNDLSWVTVHRILPCLFPDKSSSREKKHHYHDIGRTGKDGIGCRL